MWENETEQQAMQPQSYLYPPKPAAVSSPPRSAPEERSAAHRASPPRGRSGGTNYILIAQMAVCLAMLAFVLLVRQTDPELYRQMGQQYQAALEQGVDLSGQQELVKFTEDAVAKIRDAAQQAVEEAAPAGGGVNHSSAAGAPAGYSLGGYTLSQAPALPLEQFWVSSAYGHRTHPITGEEDFHGGLDLAAAEGTPVACVLDGVVLQTGTSDSYGNYVRVLHSGDFVSTYNHLSAYEVKPGQRLQKGQKLGEVGSTGMSTGPHLHLEFLLHGIRVDPAVALGVETP